VPAVTDFQIDLSKRITPDTDVTIRDQWQRLKPAGLPAVTGRRHYIGVGRRRSDERGGFDDGGELVGGG